MLPHPTQGLIQCKDQIKNKVKLRHLLLTWKPRIARENPPCHANLHTRVPNMCLPPLNPKRRDPAAQSSGRHPSTFRSSVEDPRLCGAYPRPCDLRVCSEPSGLWRLMTVSTGQGTKQSRNCDTRDQRRLGVNFKFQQKGANSQVPPRLLPASCFILLGVMKVYSAHIYSFTDDSHSCCKK